MSSRKHWVPLESNPQVLTSFGHELGLSPLLSFSDVFSMDLLDMVPSPRYAVLFLFPLTEKLRGSSAHQAPFGPKTGQDAPFFCRQTIGNACGTIALIHAALNVQLAAAPLTDDSFLANFFAETLGKDPDERAEVLLRNEGLDKVHGRFAAIGQTAPPAPNEKVDLHFVCFVEKGGRVYELDGRMTAPLDHGECAEGQLLETASGIIRDKFMKLDPNEHRFTILAMTMGE